MKRPSCISEKTHKQLLKARYKLANTEYYTIENYKTSAYRRALLKETYWMSVAIGEYNR